MNDQNVTIVHHSDKIHISIDEATVLRNSFQGYSRIALEAEFGMGFSGCRVFRVRPVEASGVAHRPALIKIGPISLITREWEAYNTWVQNTLPGIAWVTSEPIVLPGSSRGCLRYELIGSGIFDVQSLSQYFHQATIDDLLWVLHKRLFPVMSRSWWLVNRAEPVFQYRSDYDQLLPVNLMVRATKSQEGSGGRLINPVERSLGGITIGSKVRLTGLAITEIDPEESQLTLNLPRSDDYHLADSLRLRVKEVPTLGRHQVGDIIERLDGIVTDTRQSMIEVLVREALDEDIDLSRKKLRFSSGVEISNPLLVYEDILNSFLEVNLSTIHGDFNLENILIDPETRDVKVIDFATVRQGHNLHDLLRLETEVVSKLIPPALNSAALPPESIKRFYDELGKASFGLEKYVAPQLPYHVLNKPFAMLQAIRKEARNCFFYRDDPTEYYQGLVIYLLGSIKFKNLDAVPNSKKIAFLGAGTVADQLKLTIDVRHAPITPPYPKPEKQQLDRKRTFVNRLPWPWTGIAMVLLAILSGWIIYDVFIKPPKPQPPIPVAQFCEIEKKLVSEIVDGPAAAGELSSYFSLANPELMSHIDEIETAYLDGQIDQGLTYIWGSPGVGKSFITRNRLIEGFPGNSCLIKLGDVLGDASNSLSFEVVDVPDLTTVDGQMAFDSMPAVVQANDYELENLLEVAECKRDGNLVPLIIFDDIDEIHSETSKLILKSLDQFILEVAESNEEFVHVIVVGRSEGFAPWYQDSKRSEGIAQYLSVFHLNGPRFLTTGDLEFLANNQFSFVYGADTWEEMNQDERAAGLVDGYIRIVEQHSFLSYSIRQLAIAIIITDLSTSNANANELKLKAFIFDELLRRASNVHGRPLSSDDQYRRILEDIAVLYATDEAVDDQGFFTVDSDDTVQVMADGQSTGEVFVRDVLDHSGIAILKPASLSTTRYKLEPAWVHSHLVELRNQRELPNHDYQICFENS